MLKGSVQERGEAADGNPEKGFYRVFWKVERIWHPDTSCFFPKLKSLLKGKDFFFIMDDINQNTVML